MSSPQDHIRPPRLATWLLESFCSYDFLSTAKWDLEELYLENLESKGKTRAALVYYQEVFGIIIHLFFKGKSQYSINTTAMLKHNIIISLRSFNRKKGTFLINLFGLSTGLAATILIFLWVQDEKQIDGFHENDNLLYQVMRNAQRPDEIRTYSSTPIPLASSIEEEIPEIEKAVTLIKPSEGVASVDEHHVKANVLLTSNSFFELFSFPVLTGNSQNALSNIKSVALSKSFAEKLFGQSNNVIGKSLNLKHYAHKGPLEVSAVFTDPPSNSTLQFDVILSLEVFTSANQWAVDWNGDEAETYVLLTEGSDLNSTNDKIDKFLEKKEPEDRKGTQLFLQQFSKRYLYGEYENGTPIASRARYTQLFTLIALFIVLIGCINFINLSTAQATQKMKEIGIKKALGSKRVNLILQFLTETVLLALIAMCFAVLIVSLFIPVFNNLVSKELSLEFTLTNSISALGIAILVGVFAGSYPAFYISGFRPISVLKGTLSSSSTRKSFNETLIRKGLVIFQFAVSLIFVIAFIVINQQVTFVQTTDIGYDRDDLIHFKMKGGYGYTAESFLAAVENLPGVVSATNMTSGSIVGNPGQGGGFTWDGQTPEQEMNFGRPQVGNRFVETLGIELIEGRDFSNEFVNEHSKLIINKAAADLIGIENIIGSTILDSDEPKQIIGVVENFNTHSLREEILPTFIRYYPKGGSVLLRLTDGLEQETISRIRAYYNEVHPDIPFEYTFVDQQYNNLYKAETRVAKLSSYFTTIAIIISCLGIFGLASFTVQKRAKEIAIRKLLGSSINSIIQLLSIDFLNVILIAIALGIPTSFYIMNTWLDNFAFRIDLKPAHFILSSLAILLLAWLSILARTAKSAHINIAESLKTEG